MMQPAVGLCLLCVEHQRLAGQQFNFPASSPPPFPPVAPSLPADNPYAGGNEYSCTVGGGQACQQAVACTLSGGSGNNAVLNVNVYAK
jgi:hypothetical protein